MENRVYYGEYSLSHWIKLILKGNIELPEYQRGFVWDESDLKKLIETLEKKEFIPPVTIGAFKIGEENKNYILDGQQRLTSVLLAYLKVFPIKDKFKELNVEIADDNDNEENESNNRIEWSFRELLNLGKSENEISKKLNEEYYKTNIIDKDETFFEQNFIGFAYIVPEINSEEEQQKYYSTVFKNINTQGVSLAVEESRRALYFLKKDYDKFFETEIVNTLKVKQPTKPKDVDFIKYLSLLSQYKKDGKVDRLACGYSDSRGKSLESYYEEYIYSIVNDDATDLFEKFASIFPGGNYQDRFNKLKQIIESLFDTKEFTSIIDLDVYLFGLVYKVVFENKSIDISKKEQLLDELKGVIQSLKRDDSHKKSPGKLKYLKERIKQSIEVYNKYEAQ